MVDQQTQPTMDRMHPDRLKAWRFPKFNHDLLGGRKDAIDDDRVYDTKIFKCNSFKTGDTLNKLFTHRPGDTKMCCMFKKSKKAFSTGFAWIYGLVTVFGLGILYVVFNQVFKAHLVPVIKGMANSSSIPLATQASVNAGIDKYMAFFDIMPFVLIFCVIIYMIISAIRKEQENQYV